MRAFLRLTVLILAGSCFLAACTPTYPSLPQPVRVGIPSLPQKPEPVASSPEPLRDAPKPPPAHEISHVDWSYDDLATQAAKSRALLEAWRANPPALDYEGMERALNDELYDQTHVIHQDGHGIYVEYNAPDGNFFMWYPGKDAVVSGRWGVADVNGQPRACFKYLQVNQPLTGEFEPEECVRAEQLLSRMNLISVYEGDPFGLASGNLPYVKSANNLPVATPTQ